MIDIFTARYFCVVQKQLGVAGAVIEAELTATEINLLANYTAWVIMTAQSEFASLFRS